MVTVVIGAKVQPRPIPARISGARNVDCPALSDETHTTRPMPAAKHVRPNIRMYLPPMRSVARPDNGATNIDVSGMGAIVRPALRALKPRTDCRKIVSGRKSPIMPKETMAARPLPTVKLRSLKGEGGPNGGA